MVSSAIIMCGTRKVLSASCSGGSTAAKGSTGCRASKMSQEIKKSLLESDLNWVPHEGAWSEDEVVRPHPCWSPIGKVMGHCCMRCSLLGPRPSCVRG